MHPLPPSAKRFLRASISAVAMVIAFDGTIGVHRWWTESLEGYLQNLTYMVVGFLVMAILASTSKTDFLGLLFLAAAINYVADYEVGGPSKIFLTPFDPLLGFSPVFENGRWMGMLHIEYRRNMAIAFSLLAGLVLGFSKTVRGRASGPPLSSSS